MAAYSGILNVKPSDTRINYNLLPGEVLMTCPYIKSHAVLPIKFGKHVLNCHRLHVKDQQSKGLKSLYSICKYDRSHHVENALLDHHHSNCNARLTCDDDGWDLDEDASTQSSIPKYDIKQIPVTKHDEATLKFLHSEDWDEEPDEVKQFNPEKKIRSFRKAGYNVVRDSVGLTKSEKKEFYDKEAQVMTAYTQQKFLERVRNENSSVRSSRRSTVSTMSTPSTDDDNLLLPIKE